MAAIKYTAQRGLSLLGDEEGAWMADTTAETLVGGELVTNGDFATDTDWTKGAGWTIASGVATHAAGSGGDLTQVMSVVIGRTYIITFDVTSATTSSTIYVVGTSPNYETIISNALVGSYSYTFVAANTTIGLRGAFPFDGSIDNVSVRLAVPDLSTANNGLGVYGSIVKSEVAVGAGLMGYSLSTANYAHNPNTSLFRLGASGVRTEVAWVNNGAGTGNRKISGVGTSANNGYSLHLIGGAPAAIDRNVSNSPASPVVINDSKWHMLVAVFNNATNTRKIYVDGVLAGTNGGSTTDNITNEYSVGKDGNILAALPRSFDYELTAAQIKARYDKEKHLFKKYSTYAQEGQQYSYDIPVSEATPSVRTHKTDNVSLDRTQTESIVNGDDNDIDITTGLLHRTDSTYPRVSQLRELMHATRASEPFEIDLYGTVASPDEPKTVIRVGDRVQESREGKDWFRAGFKVREQ